jgi:hypothetical protein
MILREGSSPKAETRHPVRDLRGSVSGASRARPAKAGALELCCGFAYRRVLFAVPKSAFPRHNLDLQTDRTGSI